MRTWEPSQTVIKKTELAIQLLEKLEPLILCRNLIRTPIEKLTELEDKAGVKLPPDYKYWVTTVGTGFVDFIFGSVSVWSIYEIGIDVVNKEHTKYNGIASYVTPLTRFHSGSPHGIHISGLAVSDEGLSPVIASMYASYNGLVSPSWPHFIISGILKCISNISRNNLSSDQRNFIEQLPPLSISDIDPDYDELVKISDELAIDTHTIDKDNELMYTKWSDLALNEIAVEINERYCRVTKDPVFDEITEENEWLVFENILSTTNALMEHGFHSLESSELGGHLHALFESLQKYDESKYFLELLSRHPWRKVREGSQNIEYDNVLMKFVEKLST